jgi:DNA-binding MarR family transcriptional regulator
MVQANHRGGGDPVLEDVLRGIFRIVQQVKQTVHSDTVDRAALVVLFRLKDGGPVRLSDLAAHLMLDLSTVSRQVKALEERGLVRRTADPDDRRAARVEVAPAGYAVLDAAWGRRQAWLEDSLADWPTEDRAALATMLHRFADALHAGPAPVRPRLGADRTTYPVGQINDR